MNGLRVMRCLAVAGALSACSTVAVNTRSPEQYITQRYGDILSTDHLSISSSQTLATVGLTPVTCQSHIDGCLASLEHFRDAIGDEQRLSTQAELWLSIALAQPKSGPSDDHLNAYLEAARAAYAYLFYTDRSPKDRTLEARQGQVAEFYNYATLQATSEFFQALPNMATPWASVERASWTFLRPNSDVSFGTESKVPSELIPAAGLQFKGLRNVYKRDGLGAVFVAASPSPYKGIEVPGTPWRQPDYVSMTGMLLFPGATQDEVMSTRQVQLIARDPYSDDTLEFNGKSIPVAGDFTAPYVVWAARARLHHQAYMSLLGYRSGISHASILLMRPYDPHRIIVVMIHGLASSPEAWLDVGNELMGDAYIRDHFQIWQVYYPTNSPVAVNLAEIRKALVAALDHFDPTHSARATHHMVVVGHSMGGIIARLLVSSSDHQLSGVVPVRSDYPEAKRKELQERLRPYLEFDPLPNITRLVFLATPHRGSPTAESTLARAFAVFIRLPSDVLRQNAALTSEMRDAAPSKSAFRVHNSIDNLDFKNPFIVASSTLPMAPGIVYHSIIGIYKGGNLPLSATSDGVVPYWSSHLEGAESELSIPSWHNVQKTPEAIIEIRRILKLHAQSLSE